MQSQYQTAIISARKDKFLLTNISQKLVETVRTWLVMCRWSAAGKIASILKTVAVHACYCRMLGQLVNFTVLHAKWPEDLPLCKRKNIIRAPCVKSSQLSTLAISVAKSNFSSSSIVVCQCVH